MGIGTVLIVLGIAFLALVAGAASYLYIRRKRQERYASEIEELFLDISYALEDRGARHPQLIENKLAAAENYIQDGQYEEAEYVLKDLRNIVQLS